MKKTDLKGTGMVWSRKFSFYNRPKKMVTIIEEKIIRKAPDSPTEIEIIEKPEEPEEPKPEEPKKGILKLERKQKEGPSWDGMI